MAVVLSHFGISVAILLPTRVLHSVLRELFTLERCVLRAAGLSFPAARIRPRTIASACVSRM